MPSGVYPRTEYHRRINSEGHIGILHPKKSKENKSDNRPQNLIAFASKTAHRHFECGKNVSQEEIIFDGRTYKQGGTNE